MNQSNTYVNLSTILLMGEDNIFKNLMVPIHAVRREGRLVLWIYNPVNSNTPHMDLGYKTWSVEAIHNYLHAYFHENDDMGYQPGGFNTEITENDVAECMGSDV